MDDFGVDSLIDAVRHHLVCEVHDALRLSDSDVHPQALPDLVKFVRQDDYFVIVNDEILSQIPHLSNMYCGA